MKISSITRSRSQWKRGLSPRQRVILGCAFICMQGVASFCSIASNTENCPSDRKLSMWNGLKQSNMIVESMAQIIPQMETMSDVDLSQFSVDDELPINWNVDAYFGPNSLLRGTPI